MILLTCGQTEEARAHFERAIAGSREVGDLDGESNRMAQAAEGAAQAGEYEQAKRRFERAILLGRETGFLIGVATRLMNLAGILLDQDQAKAAALLEEALTLARQLGQPKLELQAPRKSPSTSPPIPLFGPADVDRGPPGAATYNGAVSNTDLEATAERLRQTLDLFEAGLSMKRAQLRRGHPEATEDEIEALLQAWLGVRAGAEHGDAPGRVRRLDARSA